MRVRTRRYLAAMAVSGAVAIAAILLLWYTADRWFTPYAEAVGGLSTLAFAGLGLRWSVERFDDVYGD